MTAQLDDRRRHPVAATAAARMAHVFGEVHPPTRLNAEPSLLPVFDVSAEPITGRLSLVGELDLAGSQRLRDAITAILACDPAEVVVDLARLHFIDAAGIGLLIELRHELAAHDVTVRIVNPDARTRRVFSLCGLSAMPAGPGAS
jgi:anti-sigma B factor antagonist